MKIVTLVTALLLLCGFASGQQTFCSAQSSCTVTGLWTFTNPIVDNSMTMLRPSQFTGVDACAKISAAFAFAIAQGWTSATVDARERLWTGQQHCAASPFAGVSNNGTFTGVLLTQGTQFVTDVPIVVPGGIRWDGSGPRSLTDPRIFAGTSVQPSSTYAAAHPLATNPIVQYGATADTSSPQKIWLTNLAVGCLAPGASYVAATGSMGIFNGNGQEGSGGEFLDIVGCQYGLGVDVASVTGGAHSGFDSSGFHHVAITVPSDAAAGGLLFGNTALSAGAIADVFGFEDITITGTPSGTEAGFCADIEGSMTYLKGIRCYFTAKGISVGNALTSVGVSIDTVDTESNASYPMSTIVELGTGAGYLINVSNVRAGGTTTNILTDANYPGGACTLLQSSEAGIGFYSRGIGGGTNGAVLSTSRTACTSKNIVQNVASTVTANTFSAGTQQIGAENGTSTSLKVAATNTATTGANFPSNTVSTCGNFNNGTTAADVCSTDTIQIGAGATPSTNRYVAAPTNAPGGTALNLGGPAANQIWGFVNVGGSLGNTTLDVTGPIKHFTSGQTFSVTVSQPTVTASRTNTWPDAGGTILVAPAATTTGRAACIKGAGQIGYCSTQPDATGACTCN